MPKPRKSKREKKPSYFGPYVLASLHLTDLWVKWHTHWFPREQHADDNKEPRRKETDNNSEEGESEAGKVVLAEGTSPA
jgi:hypothetical protein